MFDAAVVVDATKETNIATATAIPVPDVAETVKVVEELAAAVVDEAVFDSRDDMRQKSRRANRLKNKKKDKYRHDKRDD